MKRRSLSLLILLSFIPQNVCAQDKPQISQESRYGNAIILLAKFAEEWDRTIFGTKYKIGSVTVALMNALQQQVGIIIVPRALTAILIKNSDPLPFNPTDWEIYKVESLLIFVPKKYRSERGIAADNETSMIQLGLKTNSMEKLPELKDLKDLAPYVYLDQNFEFDTHSDFDPSGFIKLLPKIFLTLNDKEVKGQETLLPLWNVYVQGHGGSEWRQRAIIGLSPQDFKDTLRFFNTLPTNLFVYNTCFAGGANLNIPYLTKGIPDIYNFTIVSAASVDAPTWTPLTVAFTAFFQKASGKNFIDYKDLVSNIISNGPSVKNPVPPVIRGRGTGWFDLQDFDKKTEKLTNVKAAVAGKQIKIGEEKEFLFLATYVIDTLNIAGRNLKIIPIAREVKAYSIHKIIIDRPPIGFLLSFFPSIREHKISAEYYIDEINRRGPLGHNPPNTPQISKVSIFLNILNTFAKDSVLQSACFISKTPEGEEQLFVFDPATYDVYRVEGAREKEYAKAFEEGKETSGEARFNLEKLKEVLEKRYPSQKQKSSEPVASAKSKRHKKIVAQKIQNHRTALA
jgi:hypothetical protein